MSAPWHGKAHIPIADSAFSSIATAVALKQHGTYFIGIVKQLIICTQSNSWGHMAYQEG